jgi:hypothetical protein
MQNVRWCVKAIAGLDPDAAPHSSRLVMVSARYDSAALDGHVASHDFEVWVPAELMDIAVIEREAYRALREHLTVLRSSLPHRWPRFTARP